MWVCVCARAVCVCVCVSVVNDQCKTKEIVSLGPERTVCCGKYFVLSIEFPQYTHADLHGSLAYFFPIDIQVE